MSRANALKIFLLAALFLVANTPLYAAVVLEEYGYAWSNNVGYINFSGVTVTDTELSGYAWSTNRGWINLSPAEGGIRNDGSGNLSGFAWGEQLGWIDFNDVSINPSTGRFSGTATGSEIGVLTFDCATYCDVRTDWRMQEEEPEEDDEQNYIRRSSKPRDEVLNPLIPPESVATEDRAGQELMYPPSVSLDVGQVDKNFVLEENEDIEEGGRVEPENDSDTKEARFFWWIVVILIALVLLWEREQKRKEK